MFLKVDVFGYGRYWDYGARFYDPAIGRFTGVDPISDQFPHVTTYNYAENEPIANINLWGLQSADVNDPFNKALMNAKSDAERDKIIADREQQLQEQLPVAIGVVSVMTPIDETTAIMWGLSKVPGVSRAMGALSNGVSKLGVWAKGLFKSGDNINSVTNKLENIAGKASGLVDDVLKQPVKGTKIHSEFQNLIKNEFGENALTEVSFKAGQVVKPGTKGSIRIDALIKGSDGNPIGIFDLKTGKAGFSSKRIDQIRSHLPEHLQNIPIKEIRP